MQELVITNHQWLFDKLSRIVEYSFARACDTQEESRDLKNGIFKRTLLGNDCLDISKDFEVSQIDTKTIDPIIAFLNLLEHLRITAPLNESVDKYFMPCLLQSCDLNDIEGKIPEYNAEEIKPLLIQFKSKDDSTYGFPRGIFCFLVVELMITMKWELFSQPYVNLVVLCNKDTAHYVTLIDRIFCLEVHVTYKKGNNIHNEVREAINWSLKSISNKLRIYYNLSYGFFCLCQLVEEMHISYLSEDNTKFCWCLKKSSTELTDVHKIWLNGYFKVTDSSSKSPQEATTAADGSPLSKRMKMEGSGEDAQQKSILSQKPEMWQLNKYVVPLIQAHWEDVAYNSFHHNIQTVKGIKSQHKNDTKKCCQELFELWLSTKREGDPKDWQTLLKQLEEVPELAASVEDIKEQLGIL